MPGVSNAEASNTTLLTQLFSRPAANAPRGESESRFQTELAAARSSRRAARRDDRPSDLRPDRNEPVEDPNEPDAKPADDTPSDTNATANTTGAAPVENQAVPLVYNIPTPDGDALTGTDDNPGLTTQAQSGEGGTARVVPLVPTTEREGGNPADAVAKTEQSDVTAARNPTGTFARPLPGPAVPQGFDSAKPPPVEQPPGALGPPGSVPQHGPKPNSTLAQGDGNANGNIASESSTTGTPVEAAATAPSVLPSSVHQLGARRVEARRQNRAVLGEARTVVIGEAEGQAEPKPVEGKPASPAPKVPVVKPAQAIGKLEAVLDAEKDTPLRPDALKLPSAIDATPEDSSAPAGANPAVHLGRFLVDVAAGHNANPPAAKDAAVGAADAARAATGAAGGASALGFDSLQPNQGARPALDRAVAALAGNSDNGNWHVTLRLDPPELGRLHIHARMDQGALTIQIATETEAVRRMVEARLPELRDALGDRGIKFDRADVTLRGAGEAQTNSRESFSQPQPDSQGRSMPHDTPQRQHDEAGTWQPPSGRESPEDRRPPTPRIPRIERLDADAGRERALDLVA